MKREIWITAQVEGMHCWPEAPDVVGFLRNPHRHIFHVKLWLIVEHNDRDTEFFIVKTALNDWLESQYGSGIVTRHSCERMADDTLTHMRRGFPNAYKCEFSEDGENGAIVSLE